MGAYCRELYLQEYVVKCVILHGLCVPIISFCGVLMESVGSRGAHHSAVTQQRRPWSGQRVAQHLLTSGSDPLL